MIMMVSSLTDLTGLIGLTWPSIMRRRDSAKGKGSLLLRGATWLRSIVIRGWWHGCGHGNTNVMLLPERGGGRVKRGG